MKRLLSAALVGLSVVIIGCATTNSIRTEPISNGVSRSFPGKFDVILRVSRESMVDAGLHIEEATKIDEHTWMIIGRKDATAFSMGELVRVVVTQAPPGAPVVRVVTEKRSKLNVGTKDDYSDAIFGSIELKLK